VEEQVIRFCLTPWTMGFGDQRWQW